MNFPRAPQISYERLQADIAVAAVAWVNAQAERKRAKSRLQASRAAFFDPSDTAEPQRRLIQYLRGDDGHRIYWKYPEFGQRPYADASDDPIVIEHNRAYQEWRHATRVAGAALGRLKQLCKRAMP